MTARHFQWAFYKLFVTKILQQEALIHNETEGWEYEHQLVGITEDILE